MCQICVGKKLNLYIHFLLDSFFTVNQKLNFVCRAHMLSHTFYSASLILEALWCKRKTIRLIPRWYYCRRYCHAFSSYFFSFGSNLSQLFLVYFMASNLVQLLVFFLVILARLLGKTFLIARVELKSYKYLLILP